MVPSGRVAARTLSDDFFQLGDEVRGSMALRRVPVRRSNAGGYVPNSTVFFGAKITSRPHMAAKKKAEDTETAAQEIKAFAKSLLKVPARAQHRLA